MKEVQFLTSNELEEIFASIKATSNDYLGDEIYNNYLPYIDEFAQKYRLNKDDVKDIFNENFSFLYDKVVNNILNPSWFESRLKYLMDIDCEELTKKDSNADEFKSRLLLQSYQNEMEFTDIEKSVANEEFASQSLLFTINFLNDLKANPDKAIKYNLDEMKINIIKDYYGINQERRALKLKEIASKYGLNEKVAQARLVKALSVVRKMDEFQPIKQNLR